MRWTRWPLDLSGALTTSLLTNSRKSAGVSSTGSVYVKDPTPKTIKIKQGVANSLIFENAKTG